MRADRLLRIVSLLRRHGRLSAAELAQRLEVTPRTVLRDMEALSAAGVPVYAERGRSGGFALLSGYRPAVEELTAAETQALLLSATGVTDQMGLGGTLATALRKISGALDPALGRAADRVSERIVVDPDGWWSRPEELPHFATVQAAVLQDRRLRLRYQPRDPTRTGRRTVDPYGLLQAGGIWYLIAAHRGRPRTYRIARIDEADLLAEASTRPADLDLPALWRQLRSSFARPPTVTVRIEICDGLPREVTLLLSAVGSAPPRLEIGPPVIVETEVLGIRAATAALAGLGARIRVLEPPELVEALISLASETTALYARTSPRALT